MIIIINHPWILGITFLYFFRCIGHIIDKCTWPFFSNAHHNHDQISFNLSIVIPHSLFLFVAILFFFTWVGVKKKIVNKLQNKIHNVCRIHSEEGCECLLDAAWVGISTGYVYAVGHLNSNYMAVGYRKFFQLDPISDRWLVTGYRPPDKETLVEIFLSITEEL